MTLSDPKGQSRGVKSFWQISVHTFIPCDLERQNLAWEGRVCTSASNFWDLHTPTWCGTQQPNVMWWSKKMKRKFLHGRPRPRPWSKVLCHDRWRAICLRLLTFLYIIIIIIIIFFNNKLTSATSRLHNMVSEQYNRYTITVELINTKQHVPVQLNAVIWNKIMTICQYCFRGFCRYQKQIFVCWESLEDRAVTHFLPGAR